MTKIARWTCEVCGNQFDNEADAIQCETVPTSPPSVAVGDIVFAHAGFGWFDGDRAWVANADAIDQKGLRTPCPNGHGNCFGDCCTYRFFYAVTAVDFVEGRWRYHLATNAMLKGYRRGYTFDTGHYAPERVAPAAIPAVLRDGVVSMLGEKASHLI